MKKFGDFIVKNKVWILIICLLALIPSIIGMIKTKINYNILVYLPKDIETMKGERILSDDFNLGSFSISVLDNMSADDALRFENKVKEIDGVNKVVSLYDVVGTEIPLEMLPQDIQDKLVKGNSTLLLITFKDSISDETTMEAVSKIRTLADDTVKVGGMTAMVLDTKNLSDSEVTTYVLIAVACCILVLMFALDSYTIPFLLLANIGIAVLYNMGTNLFLGNISYITKAISSILQLGVTTDFSIFLYHQYEHEKKDAVTKEEAMSKAIGKTLNSIIGSSTTTIAGFLALCTMQLTLGKDIGIVMAKGVLFGVITVVTLFPALLLVFDKIIDKTAHKSIIPEFTHLNDFIAKKYKWILLIFVLLLIPAWWGQKNTKVYYNLDRTLPTTLASSIANKELEKKYNIVSPMIILASRDMSNEETNQMINEIKKMDHIDLVLSYSELSDLNIPEEMIDSDLKSIFQSNKYNLILINSTYEKATDELNNQITKINKIVKKYDQDSILAGEGALTNDLVKISATDFNNVNYTSIAIIFVIIILVLHSYSLPIILISTIEFAIFVNMAFPYYTGVTIPFVSSIVIGTIQLGATIDYAILMTNKYLEKRKLGASKNDAVKHALNSSVNSIFTSGMCFFAATFGVGVYSKLEMVGSLCTLISRGAIISMIVVIFVLPSLLLTFDKIICKTTKGFKKGDFKMKKELKVAAISALCLMIPFNVSALTKEETVYVKMDNQGTVNKTIVSEHLRNNSNNEIKDLSYLTDITNTNGNEKYTLDGNNLTWDAANKDIYYKGLTTKNLPLSVKITYTLDDKTYDDLSSVKGKSGHVKVNIKFTNNDKHGSLYTPFTVILISNIDNDNNTNIAITNGEVIDNGKKTIVTGVAMPGLNESLDLNYKDLNNITISYDTTKFDTLSMYAVATPKFLKTSEITSKLNELYTSMDLLNSSSTALVNGSKELASKMSELNNGINEEDAGIKAAYSGILTLKSKLEASLSSSSSTLDSDTLNQIKALALQNITSNEANIKANAINNVDHLIYKIDNSGNFVLDSNNNKIYSDSTLVVGSKASNEALSTAMAQGITDQQTLALIGKIAAGTAINTYINTMEQTAASTSYTTAQKIAGDTAISVANEVYGKAYQTTGAELKTLDDALNTLTNGLYKLKLGSYQITTGTSKLVAGTNNLYEGINKFDNEGIKVLYKTINTTIKTKANTLNELSKLSNNYNSFGGVTSGTNSETKFIIQINK